MSAAPAAKRQKVANAKPAKPAKAASQKVYMTIYEKVPIGQSDYKSADTEILGLYTTKAAAVDAAKDFAQGVGAGHGSMIFDAVDRITAWGPKNGYSPQAIGAEPTGDFYHHVYVKGMRPNKF